MRVMLENLDEFRKEHRETIRVMSEKLEGSSMSVLFAPDKRKIQMLKEQLLF